MHEDKQHARPYWTRCPPYHREPSGHPRPRLFSRLGMTSSLELHYAMLPAPRQPIVYLPYLLAFGLLLVMELVRDQIACPWLLYRALPQLDQTSE